MPRFFVRPDQVKETTIEIIGQDVKHIRDVLRLSHEAKIEICNGQGTDYNCIISEIGKDSIRASILGQGPSKSEPQTKIILFQSLIKGDKFEWVIQKAIEIGVSQIVPMQSTHCVSKMDQSKKSQAKVARWNKIAQSAAKQSGRGMIPEVTNPMSYAEALKKAGGMDLTCIAYEKEETTNLRPAVQGFHSKTIGVLIGPEGGFSEKEISQAEDMGAQSITLGPRILRSETASIVLVANILYELGEMNL